jgi:HNH endonuclease
MDSGIVGTATDTNPALLGWDRFMSKVRVDDATGCWVWQGYIDEDGYGRFTNHGETWRVHRITWAAYRDEFEPLDWRLTIDHLCRNRACCNPAHLRQVTIGENVRAGVGPASVNARKTRCIHGHPLDGVTVLRSGPHAGRRQRYCRTCKRARREGEASPVAAVVA